MNAGTFPWSRNLGARTALLNEDFVRELELDGYVRARYEASLAEVPLLDGEPPEERRRREIAYLNLMWFMQTLLDRMDRMGSRSGLEGRVPYADRRIIEYVFNAPWEMKLKNGVEKSLLREAFKDLLPPELLYRKKSPFPKTYSPRYEELLKERLTEIINNPNAPVMSFVDKEKALSFLSEQAEYGKPWYGQLMAAPQMAAYMIQLNHWMEKHKLGL